jgi:hypothetical protein
MSAVLEFHIKSPLIDRIGRLHNNSEFTFILKARLFSRYLNTIGKTQTETFTSTKLPAALARQTTTKRKHSTLFPKTFNLPNQKTRARRRLRTHKEEMDNFPYGNWELTTADQPARPSNTPRSRKPRTSRVTDTASVQPCRFRIPRYRRCTLINPNFQRF